MVLNSRQFKFLKNYRNVNVKSIAKREYRDENVFLKGDRALSKWITLLISNKKEFDHFFKSRSSDIVLLKVGNLHQNAKRYEARNTERVARSSCMSDREVRRSHISEREARRPLGRAPQARPFLRAKRAERDENVRAKRADFLKYNPCINIYCWKSSLTGILRGSLFESIVKTKIK